MGVLCTTQQIPTGDPFYIWQYVCFNPVLSNHPTLSFPEDVLIFSVKPSHSQNPQVTLGLRLCLPALAPLPRFMPADLLPTVWELPYLDFSNWNYKYPSLLIEKPSHLVEAS